MSPVLERAIDSLQARRLLECAHELFDVAESGLRAGHVPSDLTILIGTEGQILMFAASDWPPDRLMAHHGASAVYRISEKNGKVTVQGRAGARSCRIEAESARAASRAPTPSGTWLIPPAAWG